MSKNSASQGRIYVARESFVTELDGVPVTVVAGTTRVREGHKLMEGREQFFELLKVHYEVERATAAPGEVRRVKA